MSGGVGPSARRLGEGLANLAEGARHYLKNLWSLVEDGSSECSVFDAGLIDASLLSEAEARQVLQQYGSENDEKKIAVLRHLFTDLFRERRVHRLLPEVVNTMRTQNVVVQRLCFAFVSLTCQYVTPDTDAEERSLLLLSINAFQKDAANRNHVVRAWSLRSMTSLCCLREVFPVVQEALQRSVSDGSPFVRLTAALALVPVVKSDPAALHSVINVYLPRLLEDGEVSVVSAAFQSLYTIVSLHPDLLSLERECHERVSREFGLEETSLPLTSLFHPIFKRVVEDQLSLLPFPGLVSAIYLLTHYCRAFMDLSSRHLNLFRSQLYELMTYSSSCAVALSAATALLHLEAPAQLPTLYEEIVAMLCHWLIQQRSQPQKKAPLTVSLLTVLLAIAAQRPEAALCALPQLPPLRGEPPATRALKLRILEHLAPVAGFQFEAVRDQLLGAVRWLEEGSGGSPDALLDSLVTIAQRCTEKDKNESDTALGALVQIVTTSKTPALVDAAIRNLHRASSRLKGVGGSGASSCVALEIAKHLVRLLNAPNGVGSGKAFRETGCAAMVAVIAFHSKNSRPVALDVFRLLTRALSEENKTVASSQVALQMLNLGARLLAAEQDPSVIARLEKLWKYSLFQIRKLNDNFAVRKELDLFSVVGREPKLRERFVECFTKQSDSQELEDVSSLQKEIPSGAIWGSLSSVVSSCQPSSFLSGGRASSLGPAWLPPWASESELKVGSRQHVTDEQREKRGRSASVCKESGVSSPRGPSAADEDDDEISRFYRITDAEAEFVSGGVGSSREDDPLVSLFGAPQASTSVGGELIFGEASETDSDEAVEEVIEEAPVSDTSSSEGDWNEILNSRPHKNKN